MRVHLLDQCQLVALPTTQIIQSVQGAFEEKLVAIRKILGIFPKLIPRS
jgi:hypothetical protein